LGVVNETGNQQGFKPTRKEIAVKIKTNIKAGDGIWGW
jgi:hypothetical protein